MPLIADFFYGEAGIGEMLVAHNNAHRIFNPGTILGFFDQLKLASFSVVNDADEFVENVNPSDYDKSEYTCGLFHFKK